MAIQKINDGSDDSLSQTIYLEELFGQPVENPRIQEEIAQEAIDIILERTKKGKDIEGGRLDKYSEDYVDSAEFEQYGKTRKVNMELTGSMMDAIDLIESSPTKIVIGFTDDLSNKKAANHNRGITKGMPKRKFFGVNNDELGRIKNKFEGDIAKKTTVKDLLSLATLDRLRTTPAINIQKMSSTTTLGDLLGDLFGENTF